MNPPASPSVSWLDHLRWHSRQWLGFLVAVAAAVVLGFWIGTTQSRLLALVSLGGATLAVTLWLQERVWVLVLVGWTLTGATHFFPIAFSLGHILIMVAVVGALMHNIIRQQRPRLPQHPLSLLFLANLVWIGFIFARHPIGVLQLGSETVGGRQYFDVVMAAAGFWVVVRARSVSTTLQRIPGYCLAGTVLMAALHVPVYFLPGLAGQLSLLYRLVEVDQVTAAALPGVESLARFPSFAPFGVVLFTYLAAQYPPQTLFDPRRGRFYLMGLALAAVLAAGFRNGFLMVLAAFLLSTWFYHRGWRALLAPALGVLLLGGVIAGQGRWYELPFAAQRALSFLPGRWTQQVLIEAETSDARRGWWQRLWREAKWDADWWFGRGFGISAKELITLETNRVRGYEAYEARGAFHNGPLTTIRVVGVVGLLLLYAFMIALAVTAWRLVDRARGSPLFAVAVFLAILLVWKPLHFTFIFGAYNVDMPWLSLLAAALLVVDQALRDRAAPAGSGLDPAPRLGA